MVVNRGLIVNKGLLLVILMHFGFASCSTGEVGMDACNQASIVFGRIDHQRIGQQQQAWSDVFQKNQLKKNVALGVFGISVAALAGALFYLWYTSTQNSSADTFVNDDASDKMWRLKKDSLDAQIFHDYLEKRKQRSTINGAFSWIAGKAVKAVIYACISMLCMKLLSTSWSWVTNSFDDLVDCGSNNSFKHVIRKLLRDTSFSLKSLVVFAKESATMSQDDALHEKLRMQMARNVVVDHKSFVRSFEDYMAFIGALLDYFQDCLSTEQKEEVKQSMAALCELTDDAIKQEEKVVTELCSGADPSCLSSVLRTMQGLYNEFDRMAHVAEVLFYGDDYSLYQEPQN